ncbi:hypothetical protein HPP92_020533 [Vanilla planifolia]|uniref:Cation-transporting P-type ATPase C-terminal domain-containing protein n=2 Tax=Vanilla planifolia TaxID=51239 RepID=A0A835Q2I4_VANPL|nr:hypothetical protein HPP92_020533 [Vanilla planifolia]
MKKWMEMMAYHKLELSLKLKAWMVIDRFFHRCVQEILLGCAETGLDPKKLLYIKRERQWLGKRYMLGSDKARPLVEADQAYVLFLTIDRRLNDEIYSAGIKNGVYNNKKDVVIGVSGIQGFVDPLPCSLHSLHRIFVYVNFVVNVLRLQWLLQSQRFLKGFPAVVTTVLKLWEPKEWPVGFPRNQIQAKEPNQIFDISKWFVLLDQFFKALLHLSTNISGTTFAPEGLIFDDAGMQVGLPGFDSMPSALNMLTKHERPLIKPILGAPVQKVCLICMLLSEYGILGKCTVLLLKKTLRCLALALKRMDSSQQMLSHEDESNLTFIGLVGMLDPPREEVKNAMLSCMKAGIRVIVVTGDNKSTAESFVGKLVLFSHLDDFDGYSYSASEFEALSPLQRTLALQRMVLFTRVEPCHKKKMLVESLQNQNEVVAMTGDGVNEAPALKKADIGITMGSGTAVAKSASDMVLGDDNFASIVAAIAEGRAIYNNTKQFIRYMISSNIGEVVCIFVAAVLGIPDTLVPVQLLWVNLVTDGLPATAIGFNRQDSNIMIAKPRKVNEAVVSGWLFFRYLVVGAYIGVATIAGFIWWFVYSNTGPKLPYNELVLFDTCSIRETAYPCSIFTDRHPSTVSMTVLVVVEMFNALNNLSENQSLMVIPPWSNPWLVGSIALTMLLHIMILYIKPLSILFSVVPLSWAEWKVVLYFSFPVILIDEILKLFSRRPRGRMFNFRLRKADLLPKRGHSK